MADEQTAAQTDEQDFAIPGQQDTQPGPGIRGGDVAAQPVQAAPPQQSPAQAVPQAPQQAADQPIKTGKTFFLGNLLKTLLQGALAGGSQAGNATGPGNAFDRGFAAAQPQAQQMRQAQVSKAMSEADNEKAQATLTGIKALNAEYMWKRLPQDLQEKHMKQMVDINKFLVEQGGEVESTGDHDAIKADVMHASGTDPRILSHSGMFMAMPTGEETKDGRPEFAKVYFPGKNVLQEDYPYKDAQGNDQVIKAGTKMIPALAQIVNAQSGKIGADTKEQHKLMSDALGPVSDEKAAETAEWLQRQQKENTPLYQQNKAAVDAALPSLQAQHQRAQAEKIAQAKAMATQVTVPTAAAKEEAVEAVKDKGKFYHWTGSDGETHVGKGSEVPKDIDATPIGGAKELTTYVNEGHMSNIVQQSLNRVYQDLDQHPEVFDNATARNIMATTTEQIDRTSAGLLIAGTGGSIPLPSGMGAMINTALQNNALNATTADALKQYIADYKAMKDKAIVMQMEMQGGKIGRGAQMQFKAITDQIPNGETADSKTAHRQMENLQQTQDELARKYGNYGDFKKIDSYKPSDKGQSSKDVKREKDYEKAHGEGWNPIKKAIRAFTSPSEDNQ